MRWRKWCKGVALLLAVTGGCQRRCFVTEEQFNATTTTIASHLEHKIDAACHPVTDPCGPPPTLHDLDRKIRFLSLAEAVATALEQGTVGQPSLLFPGTALDNLVQFTGFGTSGSDAIRVFAIDPAVRAAGIEHSLSTFDAFFSSALAWNTTDQPIGTSLQTFQAGQSGVNAISQQQATAQLGVFKPLPSGGLAGITFGNSPLYTFTNLPARVNPSYQPSLQFVFDQPLLQAFGVEINQLRQDHPYLFGTLPAVTPGVSPRNGQQFSPRGVFDGNQQRSEGSILISRVRYDQQRSEFEAKVNQMLFNVEVAYWNLYGSYWTLYSREQGLRFAYETYRLNKASYEAGRLKAADFYQTRGQYELFRAQRLQAVQTVLENERQLRALMGLPVDDGTRLMPCDQPTLAPYQPNWHTALDDALNRRPELFQARQDVKAAQLNLVLLKNFLLPDLRFAASYDFNSIGTRVDGSSGNNAFRNLAEGNFSSWGLGLTLNFPIGYREAHANVRAGELRLARSMEILRDQELKTQRFLGLEYQRIISAYEQIRAQRAQREAFGEQLRARDQEFRAGRSTLDTLLEAQRFWADALANEYNSIVQYNNALVAFEFAKGTIMNHDNIIVAEGPLPECARERAVEHIRKQTTSLILRERATPPGIPQPALHGGTPTQPDTTSLPQYIQQVPPIKEAPSLPVAPTTPGNVVLPGPVEMKPEELLPTPSGPGNGEGTPGGAATPPMTPSPAPTTTSPVPATNAGGTLGKPSLLRRPSDFGTARPNP